MPTNVSYATDSDTRLETLVLHILPSFGLTGDGILNTNGLTAALNMKGAKEVVDGGLEFWHGVEKEESSNFKTQGKNDDMTANVQDPLDRLRYDPKIITNSIVVNDLDKAMNRGRAAVKNLVKSYRRQATTTIKNGFNSLWWKGTPGANDPDSIPSTIPTSATTGSIGGLTRAGKTYIQHGVDSTTLADIGSEAGITRLEQNRLQFAVGQETADIIVMSQSKFANMVGYLSTLQRLRPNDKLAQLRINSIQLGTAVIVFENTNVLGGANTINDGRIYGISSQATIIKTLAGGDGVWSTQFERLGLKLNKAIFWKWFGNLVTNNPRANWVMTDVTA